MIAPISESAVMLLRWPVWSGVSRTSNTSLRRSFKVTSAARVSNVVVTPVEISDIERTEQGATIIPIVRNEPLEIGAAISSMECAVGARAAHPTRRERPAGRRARHIVDGMRRVRERLDVGNLERCLVGERDLGGLRHHQMGLNPGIAEQFKQTAAVC